MSADPLTPDLPPIPSDWLFPSPSSLSSIRSLVHSSSLTRVRVAASSCLDERQCAIIVSYSHFAMLSICLNKFTPSLPLPVICTALTFYRRFFLLRSPLDYAPSELMAVCVSLACKCEEYHIAITRIADVFKRATQSIEAKCVEMGRLEVPLMEGIQFRLMVHHPFRTLQYWIKMMKKEDQQERIPSLEDIDKLSSQLLLSSYHTDVHLLYLPSLIGLGALLTAADQHGQRVRIEKIVENSLAMELDYSSIQPHLAAISSLLLAGASVAPPPVAECRDIDKKLKKCRNKNLDPNSTEFEELKRQRELERHEKDEERNRIAREAAQQKMEKFLMGDKNDDDGEFVISKRRKGSKPEDNDDD